MRTKAPFPVVVPALVALAVAPSALAKLPPGTTFEACGASGCRTAGEEEGVRLRLRLIEPAIEHGDQGAPAGAEPWLRIDLGFGPNASAADRHALGSLTSKFPVVFAPNAGYLGVPGEEGGYRWLPLRRRQLDAYEQLAHGVRPFPPEALGDLNPPTVAGAEPQNGATAAAEEEATQVAPIWLLSLLAGGALRGVALATRARRVRGRLA